MEDPKPQPKKVTVYAAFGTMVLDAETVTDDGKIVTVKTSDGKTVGEYQKSMVYGWTIA